MIMTLTDIGNHFHKSKYCNNYVYFFHALASTHKIYTHTAFKNYDLIFTNGDYQKKELELSETKFDFPKKEIINSGYFFFDSLRNKANFNKLKKKTIIFAPSWNYNKINLFDDYGLKIIDQLLNSNFKVILRPHPEHFHRSKKTLKKITDLFLKNPGFELDQNSNNLESLEQSEILITDNSAIVFEFLLIFKRPIIYIEYSDKIHNDKIELIPLKTLESEFKENFGNIISINNLTDLSKLCEELSNNNNLSSNKIDSFTNKYMSNVNNSANFASKYLIEKLNEIK
jgi:YidC/Oxa1 family membrane protein insertase